MYIITKRDRQCTGLLTSDGLAHEEIYSYLSMNVCMTVQLDLDQTSSSYNIQCTLNIYLFSN